MVSRAHIFTDDGKNLGASPAFHALILYSWNLPELTI
jgi:hypothetical protein